MTEEVAGDEVPHPYLIDLSEKGDDCGPAFEVGFHRLTYRMQVVHQPQRIKPKSHAFSGHVPHEFVLFVGAQLFREIVRGPLWQAKTEFESLGPAGSFVATLIRHKGIIMSRPPSGT